MDRNGGSCRASSRHSALLCAGVLAFSSRVVALSQDGRTGVVREISTGWITPRVLSMRVGTRQLNLALKTLSYRLWAQTRGRVVSNRGGGWQSQLLPRGAHPALAKLVVALRPALREFLAHRLDEHACVCPYKFSQMALEVWVNVNGPGAFNAAHRHGEPGLPPKENAASASGVYYVSGGRPGPGHLRIYESLSKDVRLAPIPGHAVLFPSWLDHAVEPVHFNTSTLEGDLRPRISIAFNVEVRWPAYDLQTASSSSDKNRSGSVSMTLADKRNNGTSGQELFQSPSNNSGKINNGSVSRWLAALGNANVAHAAARLRGRLRSSDETLNVTPVRHCRDIDRTVHAAVAVCDARTVRSLTSRRADLQIRAIDGAQPLHRAASIGHVEMVDVLLQARVAVNAAETDEYRTALHIASDRGHLEVMQSLLVGRASTSAEDAHGLKPLEWAALRGHVSAVQQLFEASETRSPTVEAVPHALGLAVSAGHLHMVETLATGLPVASLHSADIHGFSLLHLASAAGHRDLASLLVSARADLNASDAEHRQPLHLAAEAGHTALVQLLKYHQRAELDTMDVETGQKLSSGTLHLLRELLEGTRKEL